MLRQSLQSFKWTIALYIVLGFLAQFLSVFSIRTLQVIVDQVTLLDPIQELLQVIMLYGGLLVALALTNYILEYPETRLFHGIFEKLKVMALQKVSIIDYTAYQNIGTGKMIKLIENGATAGRNIIHSFYLQIAYELLPSIIFSLLFLSFYSTEIMLLILAGYIIVFIISNILLRLMYRIKHSLLEQQENMSKYSVRGFMELVVFRLNKRYKREINRLSKTADQIVQKNTQIQMIHELFFTIFALLIIGIKIFVLIYGVHRIIAGETSIGIIVAMLLLIDQVYTPIAIFNVLYVNYKLDKVAYKRFEQFLQAPEDGHLDQGKEVVTLQGHIHFEQVNFSYYQSPVLQNITFSIEPGMTVAIVGASGSGKSTIVKLMLGLLKKDSGRIAIDGVDIDELKLNDLYDHVSYMSQDAPIFDTTIRENIDFDHLLTDEQLYDVLATVQLKDTVYSFPDRLDTLVGERGMKLSGGERQRLALARIIVQQRKVVVLDEPFSALDNQTERHMMHNLSTLFTKQTVIMVTHRLQFIAQADHILLVKAGQIVGEGELEQLRASNSYFQQLWTSE